MQRGDRAAPTLVVVGLFVALPLAWFNRVLWPSLSGKSLVPYDNLYAFEPWRSLRPEVVPHNQLVSDLVLQTAVWQLHIRRALAAGELPLWNPDVFGGAPFLAAAQASVLYPMSAVFYGLPIDDALGWYTALHVSLAGMCMYVLGRVLGLHRAAAVLAGVAYMFSGYFITNATFPQVIGAAAWLPLLLAMVEHTVRATDSQHTSWLVGAVVVGIQFLSGHPETSVYALVVVSAYALVRLAQTATRRVTIAAAQLVGMLVIGTALAAVQLVPTWEAVSNNARVGARSAAELAQVAWPVQQLWTLLLPDLFGNPTHRQWLDVTSGTWQSSPTIFWGAKNYVEGGQYLGVLTWLLAVVGVMKGRRTPAVFFGALALLAVLFMVGSPVYLLLDVVPGVEQLRSPFRWVFPFTVAVSVLAGLGLDCVLRRQVDVRLPSLAALASGASALGVVAASLIVAEPFLKLSQRFVTDPAWAAAAFGNAGQYLPNALSSPAMFWGYESLGLVRLGLAASAAGLLLLLVARRPAAGVVGALAAISIDLFSVHGGFLPAADINLSPIAAARPAVVNAIQQHALSGQPWRFTTFERGDEKTLLANAGMFYGWQDVRGYDSIIPRQYASFTQRLGLAPDSLAFNRIAPVYNPNVLDGALPRLLDVTYVVTELHIDNPAMREIYRDASIAAYWNALALPRTWVAPFARVAPADQQPLERTDPLDVVYVEVDPGREPVTGTQRGSSRVRRYGFNVVELEAQLDGPAWVVLADGYAPGWRATAVRSNGRVLELDVFRAYSALRAVWLPEAGAWSIQLRYWPDSLTLGLGISGAAALVLLGVLLMSRTMASAPARSTPSPQLREPYSRVGRGA